MKNFIGLVLAMLCAGSGFAQASGNAAPSRSVRSMGVVTDIQNDRFTLHTDAGPDVLIVLGDGVSFMRVLPGATSLNAATQISSSELRPGDRVLVRGRISEDQKTILATSVVVMTKSDLAGAREAERLDWQRRGIHGTVQSVNAETKEMTIVTPTVPPTAGSPTHLLVVTLGANAVLLRYAPDSVKFSDAKPSTFQQLKVGDQVRALGTKSEDGNRFTAEKLVSGTFRTLGVKVISVDTQRHSINVTDLASGQPVLVRTDGDSKLLRLPPPVAERLAILNAEGTQTDRSGGKTGDQPLDLEQVLDMAPLLDLGDLKSGDSLIVMSTEGTNQSEVMAIDVLAGVEPIFAARPKGNNKSVLGPWSLGLNGGEGGP